MIFQDMYDSHNFQDAFDRKGGEGKQPNWPVYAHIKAMTRQSGLRLHFAMAVMAGQEQRR